MQKVYVFINILNTYVIRKRFMPAKKLNFGHPLAKVPSSFFSVLFHTNTSYEICVILFSSLLLLEFDTSFPYESINQLEQPNQHNNTS